MTKNKVAPAPLDKPLTDDDTSSEDSHLEIQPPKPKKEWIFTEARKQAFERARKARAEMGNTKKQIIETKAKLREVKKEKLAQLTSACEKENKKLEKQKQNLAPSSSEESELPEKKKRPSKKAKKVKQVMYYDSDSTSSSEDMKSRSHKQPVNVVIHNERANEKPVSKVPPRTALFI